MKDYGIGSRIFIKTCVTSNINGEKWKPSCWVKRSQDDRAFKGKISRIFPGFPSTNLATLKVLTLHSRPLILRTIRFHHKILKETKELRTKFNKTSKN